MKKNEITFDSFLIVDSDDKNKEINNKSPDISKKNNNNDLTHKNIRNKFLGGNIIINNNNEKIQKKC